jgi:hypothetical protein
MALLLPGPDFGLRAGVKASGQKADGKLIYKRHG